MSSTKRSHVMFRDDLAYELAQHVVFGTPLPVSNSCLNDNGSYVPVYNQEVHDENGRRRLHGAFTGGWSAGYYNTVGSKEGWAPSTFHSSRKNRQQNNLDTTRNHPEHCMDEEDLADATAAQIIGNTDMFSAIGGSLTSRRKSVILPGLTIISCDTMGLKLMRKMGWKDGQGIGLKVRRKARLGVLTNMESGVVEDSYIFPPDIVLADCPILKADRWGLGYDREPRLSPLYEYGDDEAHRLSTGGIHNHEKDGDLTSSAQLLLAIPNRKQRSNQRGDSDIGIFYQTSSDDNEPYELGPRIAYKRAHSSNKARRKKQFANTSISATSTARAKTAFMPTFRPLVHQSDGKPLDEKPLLKGFVAGHLSEAKLLMRSASPHPAPEVPSEWVPGKYTISNKRSVHLSVADVRRLVNPDEGTPRTIPGEYTTENSISSYISTTAGAQNTTSSGRAALSTAQGEGRGSCSNALEKSKRLRLQNIPSLSRKTAIIALSRINGSGGPYANDKAKLARYRLYLGEAAGFIDPFSMTSHDMTTEECIEETEEFYECAQNSKPIANLMATRFTNASTRSDTYLGPKYSPNIHAQQTNVTFKAEDPAENAAKLGFYGKITRHTDNFVPTSLVYKRFNLQGLIC